MTDSHYLTNPEWQHTVDAIKDGVFIIDTNGIIKNCNKTASLILNKKKRELVGAHCCGLFHGTTGFIKTCPVNHFLKNGKPTNENMFLKGKWYTVSADPIFDDNNKTIGFVHIFHDITKLKEEHDMAEKYLDTASVILLAIDTNGIVTLINKKGCEILEGKKEDILGKNWFDNFIFSEDLPKLKKLKKALLAQGDSNWHKAENYIKTCKGNKKLISWNNTIFTDASNNVIGSLSSGEDITNNRILEQKILQKTKIETIGEIAGSVIHDINNQLTGVSGYVDMIIETLQKGNPIDPQIIFHYAQQIKKASSQIHSTSEQILSFSRKIEKSFSKVNIKRMINETIELFDKASDFKITTEIENSIEEYTLIGDEGTLKNVIFNLLLNSTQTDKDNIKIILKAGVINGNKIPLGYGASVNKSVKYLYLSVSDNGSGIKKDDLDKVFTPFFTTKGQNKNTGLGLASVLRIIERHNGSITVQSEPNKETIFTFFLPVKNNGKKLLNNTGAEKNSKKIIVVDDEAIVRDLIVDMVEDSGYSVVSSESGKDALKLGREQQFDLCILDINLMDMNGVDVWHEFSKYQESCIVVFCTGNKKSKAIENILNNTKGAFVQKPFTQIKLLNVIDSFLNAEK